MHEYTKKGWFYMYDKNIICTLFNAVTHFIKTFESS